VLANDPSEGHRRLAAEAIGALGADAASASEALAKALGDGDADVRFVSAWALASIGDSAQPAVERVLAVGTPAAQIAAIRALEMLYTKSAWETLKRHWQHSGMPSPYDEAQLRAIIGEPR
jgi:HEAT repeat protein